MTTPYSTRSKEVAQQIISCDYYLNRFVAVLNTYSVTPNDLDKLDTISDHLLCMMWNDFWLCLPDVSAIRREPFFQICDLAEAIFDE